MFEGKHTIKSHLVEIYSDGDYEIWSNTCELILTGLKFSEVPKHISDSFYCEFRVYDNLRYKEISNVGIDMFDLDSNKEIKILLRNHSFNGRVLIKKGDIIGYLVFHKKEIL